MKKTILLLIFVMVTIVASLCGCSLFGNDLTKQGYAYDEICDWYVKEGDEVDGKIVEGTFINLTQSQSDLSKQYVIEPSVNRVVFIGDSSVNYTNFNINIAGRTSNVYIELQNFKFEAPVDKDGINADDVFPDYKVFIISSGTSIVQGGKGQDGRSGSSYKYNVGSSAPKDGGNGYEGANGHSAVSGNNVYITTKSSSMLTLIGGSGGMGGLGGNGEGSSGGSLGTPGKGAGCGGNGGIGGSGGIAVNIFNELKIENNGKISIIGGTGGVGGNGGRGGEGANPSFSSPDNGGHGGDGGNGGVGGVGIYLHDSANLKVSNNLVNVSGGCGGIGGNGNDGGSGHKHSLDFASQGAFPGNAGDGGNGGNGGFAINISDKSMLISVNGKGGNGGYAGAPGAAPMGNGAKGSNGKNGNMPSDSV